MVKFRLPLFKKKFHIKEPNNSHGIVSKIELAVVPVLGVDGAFKRIGFGKGMYDRFFESLGYSPKIIFVQLGECFTKEFLCEDYDIEADTYMTPYKNRKRDNVNRIKCCHYRQWNNRIFGIKKLNSVNYDLFVAQAKAKAKVIEHEAELVLKNSEIKVKEAEHCAKRRYEDKAFACTKRTYRQNALFGTRREISKRRV